MAPTPKRAAEAVATRLAAALSAAGRACARTVASGRLAIRIPRRTRSARGASRSMPGPGATKTTTPAARITVPATVAAIRRSNRPRPSCIEHARSAGDGLACREDRAVLLTSQGRLFTPRREPVDVEQRCAYGRRGRAVLIAGAPCRVFRNRASMASIQAVKLSDRGRIARSAASAVMRWGLRCGHIDLAWRCYVRPAVASDHTERACQPVG